jgi:hypothetical protein
MSGQASMSGRHFVFILVLSSACTSRPHAATADKTLRAKAERHPTPNAEPTPRADPNPPADSGPQPSEPAPPPAATVEARPTTASWNACGFPADAHASVGTVKLRVLVNSAGGAVDVKILKASEPTFADHARSCALTKTYQPAQNAAGENVEGYTPPFYVRFVR